MQGMGHDGAMHAWQFGTGGWPCLLCSSQGAGWDALDYQVPQLQVVAWMRLV